MRPASNIAGLVDDPAELADLRRRRLINRSLLGLALAVPLASFGFLAWKAGSHKFASEWLRAHHYKVDYNFDRESRSRGGSTSVKAGVHYSLFAGNKPNDALKYLGWLHRVESLDLSIATGYTDDELAVLARLTDLESLNLDRSRHWNYFNEQPTLTDAALASIRLLTRLRELNLGGQPFTDEGLANLAGMDRLQSLDLRGTKVTDVGLERLKALPALKSLDLTGTPVTNQGVLDFEAARPGVKILADHLPLAPPTPKSSR
jgi:hypothetical protein